MGRVFLGEREGLLNDCYSLVSSCWQQPLLHANHLAPLRTPANAPLRMLKF